MEEQARLLKEGRLEQLDVVNLIDEIEDLSIDRKPAVTSNLVVILKHLLTHQYQPRRRSQKLAGINRGAPAAAAQAIPARPEPSRLRA